MSARIVATAPNDGVVIQDIQGRFLNSRDKWQSKQSAEFAFVHPKEKLNQGESWATNAAWVFPAKHVPFHGTRITGTRVAFTRVTP